MCGCCVAVFSPCDYISISIGCYNVCLCVYACMCVGVCVMFACVCLHVCVHVRVYICICVYICVYVCVCMCLCVSMCMCVRLCMCTCVLCCIQRYHTRMIIAGSLENTRCIGHIFTSLTTTTNRYTAVITWSHEVLSYCNMCCLPAMGDFCCHCSYSSVHSWHYGPLLSYTVLGLAGHLTVICVLSL